MRYIGLDFDIGWKKYPIYIAPELMESEDTFGETDFNNNRIYLTDQVGAADLRNTLIHEILHVIYENCGYEGDGKIITNQEQLVTRTANALMLYSELNPELFEIMFNEELWQQHLQKSSKPTEP